MPALSAACLRSHLDPHADWSRVGDPAAGRTLDAYQTCRWGIERWAGRCFDTDAAIAAWWAAEHGRSQERWLADGLEPTAARADHGDPEAQYLIRLLLPDLPPAAGERPWGPPGFDCGDYRVKPIAPYRLAWLRQHRAALRYDQQRGAFVLSPRPH